MPIDPRIAMSFQTPQIASPMELAQNAYALKGAMQQNALAEAKMAELQRQQQSQNALRALFAGGKMPEAASIYAIDPAMGAEFEQRRAEIGRAQAAAGASEAERAGHIYKTQSAAFGDLLNMLTASNDEPSYQYNLNLARSRGFDVSSAPPAYDPAWVNNARQAVLSVKERADIEDRAAGRSIERERLDIDRQREKRLAAGVDPASYPLLAKAVAEGRMTPDRINSRNAGILEQVLTNNPDADLNAMASRGALMRNASFQQKAISAQAIPEILQNVVNAGKKLNFSDAKFVAQIDKWVRGQTQDPALTEYMTLRNDAILSIAYTMRQAGMSDYATRLEEEAAAPTMSPSQLDAWMSAQMKALAPRLRAYEGLSVTKRGTQPPAVAPADSGKVDTSNPLLSGKP